MYLYTFVLATFNALVNFLTQQNFHFSSLGDPTIFGNMKTHEEINRAIVKSLETYKYNGYAPSVGK